MQAITENEVLVKGKKAKEVSYQLIHKTSAQKNAALKSIAASLQEHTPAILLANAEDIKQATVNGIPLHVQDRILLNETRLSAIIDAIGQTIELFDPIGTVLEDTTREDGLHIMKKRVPLGVIGMIYEARPNVTVDASILAIKTNNAVILRGSSSAIESNKAIVKAIQEGLVIADFPKEAVQLIEDTSRETAKTLFTMKQYLDVLIPRGGKALIDTVVANASVPVIETGAGNCHIYLDATADYEKAARIVLNAKLQRPSVCNACESILMHEAFYKNYGQAFLQLLQDNEIDIYGDAFVCEIAPHAQAATEDHYAEEFLRLALSVKVVQHIDEAIDHIHAYGTHHSEAIITENIEQAAYFLNTVDSAAVYHNASTRFTDGFEYGYGAEIGISTQKLHARGPMGLEALTSTKYFVFGEGHIRP